MFQEAVWTGERAEDDPRGSVLIVDDDEFSRDLITRRMIRAGYAVTPVARGGEAIDLVEHNEFDIVLLDVVMPDMDGRDVLTHIRERRSTAELPVIMVTSKAAGSDIAECFRRGASDYVTKPLEFQALLARVETQMARRRAEEALKQSQDELEKRVEQRTAELRRANRELNDARNILADALDAIGDGFALWGPDDRLVTCNQQFRALFGKTANLVAPGIRFEELMRRFGESGALRAAVGRIDEWLEERLSRHRHPSEPFEAELADGSWRRVTESLASGGRTVLISTDISGIKRREIALKTFAESNRRLAAAVNATASAILITDPTRPGNPTVFANPAFTAMSGWPVEEVLGRDRNMLIGPETDSDVIRHIKSCMRAGRMASAELQLYARDGHRFWAEVNVSPIRNNEGQIVNWVVIQSDISARKETEEQLNQSQKMELVGQLTGGLAHDFNNLLTIVIGNLEFVLDDESIADGATRQHLGAALAAGRRGSELTKRMLAFARRQTLRPSVTNAGVTITSFRDFLGRSLGAEITVETRSDSDPWPIMVDRGQFENAVLNLAVNARDAMQDDGTVTVSAFNTQVADLFDVAGQQIDPGDYVCVSVADHGHGMAPDVVEKAIQPFFTTKESGKGTGLGLSMVYGFVTQSRGFLRIESEPGAGTTIELYFPRAVDVSADEELADEGAPAKGSETVLLVDDEPQVRTIAAIQLKRLGYNVLQAEDGHEALAMLDRDPAIDLLVTDIGLPGGMNGLVLASNVRDRLPEVPVLYVSGYSDGTSSESAESDPDAHFLAKPYDMAALAAAVRQALER